EVAPRSSPTPCDRLAVETIEAAQTDEEATLQLYGTVANVDPRRVCVHIASSGRNPSQIDARATFGAYWGDGSSYNIGWRIPGRQLEGRALLIGILYALIAAKPESRPLDIFTTSKNVIRAICYAAGKRHTRGWDCANGELFERIAHVIRRRSGQIGFFLVSQPRNNKAHSGARKLAQTA
ncbi:hypothetical protein B0H19DRAFT_872446, partial [Mycena capillaripes]